MIRTFLLTILLAIVPFSATIAGDQGFSGAGGFSFYMCKPDLAPLNDELQTLGMPPFDDVMLLYGGQAYGHVSYRLRIGAMGYSGSIRVTDFEEGYAREASFSMSWGGILVEYVLLETAGFEIYGGGTFGWGGVSVQLEKKSGPANWNEVWDNYEAVESTSDNISSKFEHSFFLMQPRLGLRYYLLDWLAVSGSVDLPLINLDSGGWTLNGSDVYEAPSFNLIQPFFQFSILLGG